MLIQRSTLSHLKILYGIQYWTQYFMKTGSFTYELGVNNANTFSVDNENDQGCT